MYTGEVGFVLNEYHFAISGNLPTEIELHAWYSKFNLSIYNVGWNTQTPLISSLNLCACLVCFCNIGMPVSVFVKFRINVAKINFMPETHCLKVHLHYIVYGNMSLTSVSRYTEIIRPSVFSKELNFDKFVKPN